MWRIRSWPDSQEVTNQRVQADQWPLVMKAESKKEDKLRRTKAPLKDKRGTQLRPDQDLNNRRRTGRIGKGRESRKMRKKEGW